jgi:phage terminase large subunit
MQTETAEDILRLEFKPQPKQRQLFNEYESLPATIFGYGGSRGGSKSNGLRSLMLIRRLKYDNTNGFIIRKTIDDLRDNHINPLLNVEHPALRPYYNKQEKILTLPNGSWIRFISADHYDAIWDLIGKEAADIMVDQAEQFSQEQLEFLMTCNRCASEVSITSKMLWTFNPGDIGHGYLKRVFLERNYMENEDPTAFHFIRAFGWDNVKWVRRALKESKTTVAEYYSWPDEKRFDYFIHKSDYGKKLNRLPDSQRRAQLMGDFDVFEGQFLSMWRREHHIIDPIEKVPEGAKVKGVIDYGERTVLEVGFRDFEGNVVVFAENYTESMAPSDRFNSMADMLIERQLFNLSIEYDTNMDLDLKNYTGYDKTQAKIAREVFRQRMGDKAPTMSVVSKATTDKRGYRVVCNEAMKEYLNWRKDEKGNWTQRPRLFFTRDCKEFNRTAPLLLHDPESVDGLDFIQKNVVDDPYDAAKMLLLSLRTPIEAKKEQPPKTMDEYMEREFKKLHERTVAPKRRATSY